MRESAHHPVRWDKWHFDTHACQSLIPPYDPTDRLHARVSARRRRVGRGHEGLVLDAGQPFAAVRRDIRAFIAESEAGRDVEALVEELLS